MSVNSGTYRSERVKQKSFHRFPLQSSFHIRVSWCPQMSGSWKEECFFCIILGQLVPHCLSIQGAKVFIVSCPLQNVIAYWVLKSTGNLKILWSVLKNVSTNWQIIGCSLLIKHLRAIHCLIKSLLSHLHFSLQTVAFLFHEKFLKKWVMSPTTALRKAYTYCFFRSLEKLKLKLWQLWER